MHSQVLVKKEPSLYPNKLLYWGTLIFLLPRKVSIRHEARHPGTQGKICSHVNLKSNLIFNEITAQNIKGMMLWYTWLHTSELHLPFLYFVDAYAEQS